MSAAFRGGAGVGSNAGNGNTMDGTEIAASINYYGNCSFDNLLDFPSYKTGAPPTGDGDYNASTGITSNVSALADVNNCKFTLYYLISVSDKIIDTGVSHPDLATGATAQFRSYEEQEQIYTTSHNGIGWRTDNSGVENGGVYCNYNADDNDFGNSNFSEGNVINGDDAADGDFDGEYHHNEADASVLVDTTTSGPSTDTAANRRPDNKPLNYPVKFGETRDLNVKRGEYDGKWLPDLRKLLFPTKAALSAAAPPGKNVGCIVFGCRYKGSLREEKLPKHLFLEHFGQDLVNTSRGSSPSFQFSNL
jgi:hypothetical protein